MAKHRYPAPEPESIERYESALRSADTRIRYVWFHEDDGKAGRVVVMLQVRMDGGSWKEAFREGERVPGANADKLFAAWFRGVFRLWTRFEGCSTDDLVALCRWEVGAQELRRP